MRPGHRWRHGLVAWAFWGAGLAQACTLTLGYRPEARPPLMAEAPDDSGVYLELFTRAAKRIGCDLRVERLPKLRMIEALKRGEVDFYPGMDFDDERNTYLLFMSNGLPGGLVGVSRPDLPEVTHLRQLAGRRLLRNPGQPQYLEDLTEAERTAIPIEKVVSASLQRGVEMLLRERGDFYVYSQLSVDHLLRMRPEWRSQLKVHRRCCGGDSRYHAAFAKASPHMRLEPNPHFRSDQPEGADNQRVRAAPGSVAQRFAQALERMTKAGEVQQLLEAAKGPAD